MRLARPPRARGASRRVIRIVVAIATALPLLVLATVLVAPATAVVAGAAPPILVLLALSLALAAALASPGRLVRWVPDLPRRAATRLHRIVCASLERLSGWRGATIVFALVALSLLRAWAPLDRPSWQWPGVRSLTLFHGRAQTSDALTLYASAQWLRSQGQTLAPATRRPIYTAWTAATIGATGADVQRVLLLHAAFLALALHVAGRAVGRTVGPAVALMVVALCLGYAQQFVGLVMTETLGLSLGLFSTSLLLPTLRRWNALRWSGGMLGLSTALLVRPGAQFVLPLVALAAAWSLRRTPVRAIASLLLAAAATAAVLAVNSTLVARIGDPTAGANSNVGFVLYGLSVNQGWMAGESYALEHAPTLNERERSAWLVKEAIANMQRDPSTVAKAMVARLGSFLEHAPPQTSAYIADRGVLRRWVPGWLEPLLGFMLFGGGGVVALILHRRGHPAIALVATAAAAGILLSIPFIWLDGQWRALASTMPLQALIVSFFVAPSRPPALRGASARSNAPAEPGRCGGGRLQASRTVRGTRESVWDSSALAAVALVPLVGAGVAYGVLGRDAVVPLRSTPDGGPTPYVIADPRSARVLLIEPLPEFHWLGPASMTLEQTRHEIADWGVDGSLAPLLERVQPSARSALLQTVSISQPGGCSAALLLVPPDQLATVQSLEGPMAKLGVDWGGGLPYFGLFGVLRSAAEWSPPPASSTAALETERTR